MILWKDDVMCTAVVPAKEWKLDDGREGTTYRVEISDGTGNISMQCISKEVHNRFQPFAKHNVKISLEQTNYEGRKGVKAMIIDAETVV